MSFRYSENELDNSLFVELSKDVPDENRIRELVSQGANISAIDTNGESVLIGAIFHVTYGLDIKYIKLIIDLGADVNYAEEGFNCLFDACLTHNTELVEMLLKAGANPNCISDRPQESLLDWADFDQWYEETKSDEFKEEGDEDRAKKMSEIVQLLKDYGAKSLSEIYTNTLKDFLEIFASSTTGLVTKGGNIKIEDIPNIDSALINEFKEWVANNPDKLDEYKKDFVGKITIPPNAILLQQHNEHGLSLAKKIQQLTDRNIIVNYLKVNPETFEKQNFRMVETVEM